jgi:hypothetical protein
MLAVFIHVGNHSIVPELLTYTTNLDCDVYMNFCNELVNPKDILKTKEFVLKQYPRAVFFESENRGCDIGPLFLFFDYLRKKDINYDYVVHLHTKTDPNWRKTMLDKLFPINYEKLSSEKIIGAFTYCYDYLNFFYDLEHLQMLGLSLGNVDWNEYKQHYPDKQGFLQRVVHASKDKSRIRHVPLIDIETFLTLFGNMDETFPAQAWNTLQVMGYEKISRLHYFPGNFLIFEYQCIKEIFDGVDFIKIYDSLETGKPDDRICMSRTHSWERVIPIAFQIKYHSIL